MCSSLSRVLGLFLQSSEARGLPPVGKKRLQEFGARLGRYSTHVPKCMIMKALRQTVKAGNNGSCLGVGSAKY